MSDAKCAMCGVKKNNPTRVGQHTGWWWLSNYHGLFGWHCPECSRLVFDKRKNKPLGDEMNHWRI